MSFHVIVFVYLVVVLVSVQTTRLDVLDLLLEVKLNVKDECTSTSPVSTFILSLPCISCDGV